MIMETATGLMMVPESILQKNSLSCSRSYKCWTSPECTCLVLDIVLRSGKHTACATRTQAAGALGPHSFQPFSGEKQMAKTMNILSDKGSIDEKSRKHANYVITSASVGPAKGSSGDVAHDLLSGKPPTAYLTRSRRHQLCWPPAVGDPHRRFPPGETTCESAHRLMQVEARVAASDGGV
jgi:hypothetical protein